MKWTNNKDINESLSELQRRGWTIKKAKKCIKVLSPDNKLRVVVSLTPSDRRAYTNHLICIKTAIRNYYRETRGY